MPEGTYVELVRSLFATLLPTTIMGILFVLVARFAIVRSNDAALVVLTVAGSALSLARVGILLVYKPSVAKQHFDGRCARRAERLFGATYLAFALTLGLFGARAFQTSDNHIQIVTTALLVGYAAGVAAGISLRPWIALPSVTLAIVPTVATTIIQPDGTQRLLGFLLSAFLLGGASSMGARFRSESEKITMRRTFEELARHDPLTGLANRLGFDECYREVVASAPSCLIAVHVLDLDHFKQVNDRLGHPIGDALLKAVAGRLSRMLRNGDLAARIGGDEFAILQTSLAHSGEAELLARRISRALCEPYALGDDQVTVGVSIGYTVSDRCDSPLEELLSQADAASYRAKRHGGGVREHERRAAS